MSREFFIPPDFKLPVAWFADAATPAVLKLGANIDGMEIRPQDRKMLRGLRDERVLFFSNHPTQAEPVLAWLVAQAMGSRFNYMATRRAFDYFNGMLGKLFASTGAFSVIPGIADRDSMRFARQTLAKPGGKLVLYPEGEPMCGENDSLMPFQPGIVKLGLGAFEDARKQDPAADIIVLPGFIKYVVKGSPDRIAANLDERIARLEGRLGLDKGKRNLLRRFLHVGRVLLEQAEQEYGVEPPADPEDFDFRIGRVRHAILDAVADRIQLHGYRREDDAIHKLRHLTAVLELLELNYPAPKLPQISVAEREQAMLACVKAYDFIVIKRDYLASYPSPERFYEWLARFESLVLGATPRALGGEPSPLPRQAYISFAKPFPLSEYYVDYKRDKQGTLQRLLDRLLTDIRVLLDAEVKRTEPLVAPGDLGEA